MTERPLFNMENIKLVTDQLETPLTDRRTYRVVRLRNELEILLVHDPTTDEAGACLAVDVGSMSDEIPGMAHALEHVCRIYLLPPGGGMLILVATSP